MAEVALSHLGTIKEILEFAEEYAYNPKAGFSVGDPIYKATIPVKKGTGVEIANRVTKKLAKREAQLLEYYAENGCLEQVPIVWLQLIAGGDALYDQLLVGISMSPEHLIRLTDTPPPMEWGSY
ncbi:MAG TPA: hypothetical protein VJ246_04035 [Patescibacteria group bacterium]|nr:hypothetical protein [Patescibacteria group bacterium]